MTAIIIIITAIYFFGCGVSYEKIITIRAEIRAAEGTHPTWYDYKRIILATVMSWAFVVLGVIAEREINK